MGSWHRVIRGCQPDGLPTLCWQSEMMDPRTLTMAIIREAVVREVELSTACPAECSKRSPAVADAWL